MKIEQKGVPPYTIMSSGSTEIPGHPSRSEDFLGALEEIFSLTEAGTITENYLQTTPAQIIDSKGKVVFSASSQQNMEVLQQIDKVGFTKVEIISSKA